jgi:hypothetical protein
LGIDVAGRQQRGIRRSESCPRLRDASGRLCEIQILLQRQRYEAGQLWIAKAAPPHDEVGGGGGLPLLNRSLTQVAIRQGGVGSKVIRPDRATRRKTGDGEHEESAFE